jgi:hypothetical protein
VSDTPRTDGIISHPKWNFLLSDLCRELERENTALREDKARLDWLEEKGCWLTITGQKNFVAGSSRDVIDAARKEAQP